jgi:hypothetical protein
MDSPYSGDEWCNIAVTVVRARDDDVYSFVVERLR